MFAGELGKYFLFDDINKLIIFQLFLWTANKTPMSYTNYP